MEDNRFNQIQQPVEDLAQTRQQSFEPGSIDYMATEIKNKVANKDNAIDRLKLNANIDSSIKGDMFKSPTSNKLSMTDEVGFDEVYAKAGGSYVARYPEFIKGVDNNERMARMQTTGQKWANGLSKAGINLATTVAGGIIGSVTGVSNWISSGFDSQALYTDDFNQWLDGLNEKARFKLPNFYSRQEQEMNFGQSLGTANFWAADLPHGISFTLGAIVSEGIWAGVTGGSSLSTTAARWSLRGSKLGKLTKGINDYTKVGKTMIRNGYGKEAARQAQRRATTAGKTADLLNTARFTYTSAGYEAGVEARHFMKEAEENFINYYETNYGRQPNAEEMAAFQKDIKTAGNAVYAGNIAVVGGSNIAVFGRMFDVKFPLLKSGGTLKKGMDKKLFGIGTKVNTEGGKFAREALKPTTLQKIAGRTRDFAKAPLAEGFWEEGNQNVMGNFGEDWVSQGYDVNATRDNYDMIGGLFDAYSETYTSKEGWKEIGIGMMVGLLGGGISGQLNTYGRQIKQQQAIADMASGERGSQALADQLRTQVPLQTQTEEFDEEYAFNSSVEAFSRTMKESSISPMLLADKMAAKNRMHAATIQEQEADSRGDLLGKEISRKKAILANIELNKKYDRLDESYEDFKTSLELVDSNEWAQEMGVDVDVIEEYKRSVLQEYQNLQEEYSANKDFADLIVGSNATTKDLKGKDLVAQAVAYNMTMGTQAMEAAEVFLEEINIEMAKFVNPTKAADITDALKARKILETSSVQNRENFFKLKKRRSEITKEKEDLQSTILETQRKLQRLDSQEGKQAEQSRLLELSEKLRDLENLEVELKNEFELSFQTLQAESPFTQADQETLTSEQLDKVLEVDEKGKVVGGTLAEIDKLIEAQEQSNPRRAAQLKKMFDEYRKSVYALKEYNKTVQGISNENFSPAEFVTKLESKLADWTGKEANQFTKDFFANVGNQMVNDTFDQMASKTQTQTEQSGTKFTTYESEYQEGDFAKVYDLVKSMKSGQSESTPENIQLMQNYPKLVEALLSLEQKRDAEKSRILQHIKQEGFILEKPILKSFVDNRRKEIDAKYDARIENLFKRKTQEQNTEIERLNELIEETAKDNNLISTYVGENQSEAKANRPTKEDINSLRELQNKLKGTRFFGTTTLLENSPKVLKEELAEEIPLTEQEIEELQALNQKLTNWQVSEGTMVDGINATLADLITRVAQLEQTVEENVKREQTKPEAIDIHEASEKNASASRNDVRTIQTLNGVYLKYDKNGSVFLSHVNVETLLGKYMSEAPTRIQIKKPGAKKVIDIEPSEIAKYQKQEGVTFIVNEDITFTIGTRGRINFEQKAWNDIKDSLSLQFLAAQDIDPQAKNNSFIMGYEILEDGSSVLAKSDFQVESGFVQMTAEEMRKLDRVFLYIDPKDSYNRNLLNEYNKAVKSGKQENIDKALQNLESNIGVSLMYGEKFAGFLRAGLDNNGTGDTAMMYAQIRKNAAKQLIENEGNNLINLETTIGVNFKYSGSPIFNLTKTAEGVEIQNNEIGSRELQKIKDAGFVENGQLTIGGKVDTEKVNKVYLPKNNSKTPVVVFEYAGELVAFPASLNIGVIDRSQKLVDIIQNPNLSEGQKVNEINSYLLQNGIAPSRFNLKESSLNDTAAMRPVVEALENTEIVPNLDNWAKKDFNLNDLSLQTTLPIDITNNPFNTPKLVMDVVNAEVAQPEQFREAVEDDSLRLLDKIQSYVSEILSKQGQYIKKDGTVVEDTVFTDVLDNDVLERDATNYTNKMANLNKLEKAVSKTLPTTVVNVHGKEFFKSLKEDIKKYRGLSSKRKGLTQQIKEKINQKKNQDC